MSISTIPTPTSGAGPASALAASERVQRLQTLIAQVERGPAGFAAALTAAQAGEASQAGQNISTGAGASAAMSAAGLPTSATTAIPAGVSTAGIPTAGAISSASPVPTSAAMLTSGATTTSANANAYAPLINASATRNGLDPALLYGLIQQESGFNPNATSSAGALGLTQLMPGTAASLGVTEPLNPAQSIEGGARYLGQLMRQFAGNTADALAAYNAGPGAVQQYGGVPPYTETQQYVSKVLANAAAYQQSTAGASTTPVAATAIPTTATTVTAGAHA